jgi:hypothetical protein
VKLNKGMVRWRTTFEKSWTKPSGTRGGNVLLKFPQDLSGMVFSEKADIPFSALVLPDALN